jgi:molybdate transport repressor ModE-like protein
MLDPRRVLVFRAVAEVGSFSAAARDLHLSQPSVSRAIAGLEAELGLELLRRGRDGVTLTEAGERLLARAQVIDGHLRRAEEELGALRRMEAGRAALGAFATAAATLAVRALRDLRESSPGLRVTLRQVSGSRGAELVVAGELDVALGFALHGAARAHDPDLVESPLLTEPLLLALPADHRLAGRRRVRLAELRDESWVQGAAPDSPRLVERVCRAAGFEPHVAAEGDAMQTLVAAGLGITLVPAMARAQLRSDLVAIEVVDRPCRDVFALALAGRPSPGSAALLDALVDAAAHAPDVSLLANRRI